MGQNLQCRSVISNNIILWGYQAGPGVWPWVCCPRGRMAPLLWPVHRRPTQARGPPVPSARPAGGPATCRWTSASTGWGEGGGRKKEEVEGWEAEAMNLEVGDFRYDKGSYLLAAASPLPTKGLSYFLWTETEPPINPWGRAHLQASPPHINYSSYALPPINALCLQHGTLKKKRSGQRVDEPAARR